MRHAPLLPLVAVGILLVHAPAAAQRPPVIDVHLHAYTEIQPNAPASWTGEPEARALTGPAAAEEMGIPVALHTGLGPPGGPHTFAPKFRVTLGRPTLAEPCARSDPAPGRAGWVEPEGRCG